MTFSLLYIYIFYEMMTISLFFSQVSFYFFQKDCGRFAQLKTRKKNIYIYFFFNYLWKNGSLSLHKCN